MPDEISIVVRAQDEFSNVLGNFGNIMTGIKSTLDLVSGAFNAVVDFGSQFVDAAAESQVVVAQLNQTLKSTNDTVGLSSDQLQKLATGWMNVSGFSDEAEMSAEAVLLRYENLNKDIFPEALGLTNDLARAMGIDLPTAAMTMGKALDDPASGIGRLNMQFKLFNDTEMENIKTMASHGQLAEAQAIIMDRLREKVGGAAEAYGTTFSGSLDIAKEKLDNLKELIGGPIIYLLGNMLDSIMKFAEANPIFQAITGALSEFNDLLSKGAPFWYALGVTLGQMGELSPILGDIGRAFREIQTSIDLGLSPLQAFTDEVQQFIKPLTDLLDNLITPFVASGAAITFINILLSIGAALTTFWDGSLLAGLAELPLVTIFGSLTTAAGALVTAVMPIAGIVIGVAAGMEVLHQATNGLVPSFGDLSQKFLDWVNSIDWKKVSDDMISKINSIDWASVGNQIAVGLGNIFSALGTIIANIDWGKLLVTLGNALANLFAGLAGYMDWQSLTNAAAVGTRNFFNNWEKSWTTATRNFFTNIMNDIQQGFADGLSSIGLTGWVDWWTEHVITPVKKLLGIASPSTVFLQIGKDIIQGLINGIDSMVDIAINAIKKIISSIIGPFKPILDALGIDLSFLSTPTSTGGSTGGMSNTSGTTSTPTGTGSNPTTVTYNFYGPVYMSGVPAPGSYDCPPNPIIQAGSNQLVPSGY